MDTKENSPTGDNGINRGSPGSLHVVIRYQVFSYRATGVNPVSGRKIWTEFNRSSVFNSYRDAKLHSRAIRTSRIKTKVGYTEETREGLAKFSNEKTITVS